ncbi:MAG: YaaR family protein [Treponema sp.]|nr:YaaR family protein [Treponema sp.]
MSDINPLGASTYYGGLQNATSQAAKESKKEKIDSSKKIKFSELLKTKNQGSSNIEAAGFPPEIAEMSLEDAAVFLKDAVDLAGNDVAASASTENLLKFKKSVKQFIEFVVLNNYEVKTKKRHGVSQPMQFFSKYNEKVRPKDPRMIVTTINEKLDAMTRAMLIDQKNNLQLLAQVNEIKGLIIDLMQS